MATAIIRAPYIDGLARYCEVHFEPYTQADFPEEFLAALKRHIVKPEDMENLAHRDGLSASSRAQVESDLPYVRDNSGHIGLGEVNQVNEAAVDIVYHYDNGEWQMTVHDWVEPIRPEGFLRWAFVAYGGVYRFSTSARPALTDGVGRTSLHKGAAIEVIAGSGASIRYSFTLANGDEVEGRQATRKYVTIGNASLYCSEFSALNLEEQWDRTFIQLYPSIVIRRNALHMVTWARGYQGSEVRASVDGLVDLISPIMTRRATDVERIEQIAERNGLTETVAAELVEAVPVLIDYDLISGLEFCSACASTSDDCECYTCDNCDGRVRYGYECTCRDNEEEARGDNGWAFRSRSLTFRGRPARSPEKLSRYLGVEIEVSSADDTDPINDAVEGVNASIVTDGSLPSTGAEIVTQPARASQFRRDITALAKAFAEGKTETNKDCGLHVHVDARDLDLLAIRRLIQIWAKIEPAMYDLVAYRRRSGSYSRPCADVYKPIAKAHADGIQKAIDLVCYSSDAKTTREIEHLRDLKAHKYHESRYYGLNLHSWEFRRTVEFRHHQGTVDARRIISWAETCGWVIQKARTLTDEQVSALEGTPLAVLCSLLPDDLQAWAKARTACLAQWRPGGAKYGGAAKEEDTAVEPVVNQLPTIQQAPSYSFVAMPPTVTDEAPTTTTTLTRSDDIAF